jgi:hypothetical protein
MRHKLKNIRLNQCPIMKNFLRKKTTGCKKTAKYMQLNKFYSFLRKKHRIISFQFF